MKTSFNSFKERYCELVLNFLWRQWSALGVAGYASSEDSWIIDPEALLLATTTFGRFEPRLFDEVLDWLNMNGQSINLQRLQNLSHSFGESAVLKGMAAHLAKRAVNSKWKTLPGGSTKKVSLEPLFPDLPVLGKPDELFARHGWRRGPVKLRGLSQSPDPHRPTNLLFKLRAFFGMQARAEIMVFLLTHDSGHPGEMAERLSYFPRTIQTMLNDMERSGHVLTRRDGREKHFWLKREEWRFLITWPVQGEVEFPHWVDWPPLFAALEAIWGFLAKPGMEKAEPAIQAIELRACLDKLSSTFLRENVKIPPGATGSTLVEAVLESFCQMLK